MGLLAGIPKSLAASSMNRGGFKNDNRATVQTQLSPTALTGEAYLDCKPHLSRVKNERVKKARIKWFGEDTLMPLPSLWLKEQWEKLVHEFDAFVS